MTTTTTKSKSAGVSRRGFLQTSAVASGGLMLGVSLTGVSDALAAGTVHTPNAWVHIADDNTITLLSARSEMGQGVYTSMPMLIAEELNVDIRRIKVAIAPPNGKVYGNALLGGPQLTGGSSSVRDGWDKLRLAGAQVRTMLITAAAQKWKVPESELRAENGFVLGPKGKKATYGQLRRRCCRCRKARPSRTRKTSASSASPPSGSTRRPRPTARPSSASTSRCPAWFTPHWSNAP
jgi:isoquinoline 1-oxidoreductase beta subunit